jgi:hypothetical protein
MPRRSVSWRAEAVTDTLLSLFFLTMGAAALISGYRAVMGLLPHPVCAIPNRVAAHLIILLWALSALSLVAWYLTALKPAAG